MALKMGIVDNVADAITRLTYLEKQTKDDQEMITLLKKQKDEMAEELSTAKHNFGIELFKAQQERDAALKKAEEVQQIIEDIGSRALAGVRKMKGDEAAAVPAKPMHGGDQRQFAPVLDSRLPRPALTNR